MFAENIQQDEDGPKYDGDNLMGYDESDNNNFVPTNNIKEENYDNNDDDEDDDDVCDDNLASTNDYQAPMNGSERNHDNNDHDDDGGEDDCDNNLAPADDDQVPMNGSEENHNDDDSYYDDNNFKTCDPNVWTLPAGRDDCTLEEIRRGQVINNTAPNECPVLGCGKRINGSKLDPSPGTIASGLRTHVLFVHYANQKATKKRKLGWSTKRRSQPSPKKQIGNMSSPSTSKREFDAEDLTSAASSLLPSLKNSRFQPTRTAPHAPAPGSLLNKKVNEIAAKSQANQISSLQSLMQATYGSRKDSPTRQQRPPQQQKSSFNPTTSSLFSILAGLTQQQQTANPAPRKTNQNTNTINLSHCSRNSSSNTNNNNRSANSSLLSLLNENVANSLQSQLKKNLVPDRPSYDNSMPLDSFVESLAIKTGANIGPAGIAEAKKIIEKFTKSLLCSSQTIADHYIAPFVGESPQQKPEISPSDIMLAYKMMHKSHGQP